ncbi:DUF2628 domain-containing protein [Aureimonas sp. AU22]|uniref:DUF2628 domain-containing protein n=1 Tax=Aureimonas sp. AU22 TaxID=1638162 RepID=UPI0007864025|nr:DUF2628 domain-containing protein [Aureimonas sp. AU22]
MRRYRIFEPPGAEGRTDGARFLRDGFRPWALVVPSLWLLRHRLWLPAVAAFLAEVLVKVAAPESGVPVAALLSLTIGLLVALEGPSLLARRLCRAGWHEAGAVWARDEQDAELLYFAGEVEIAPTPDAGRAMVGAPRPALRPGQSLFDLRSAS